MPLAQITIWEGRTPEKKEEIIQKVTETLCQTLNCRAEAVTVILQEVPKANWGFAGSPATKSVK